VVFPKAEHKFFLDASVDARAGRRHGQGVSNLGLEEIKQGWRNGTKSTGTNRKAAS
jgi:cytidylate kinase